MLRCRACGGAYFGAGTKGRSAFYRYYACRNRQTKGTYGCTSKRVPAEDLEAAVIDDLLRTLSRSNLLPPLTSSEPSAPRSAGPSRTAIPTPSSSCFAS